MKKWLVGLVLPLAVLLLAGCSNDLSIKLDKTQATAENDGTVVIKGNVEGKGTLYINNLEAESQPSKDGSFKTSFKTTGHEDTTLHVNYIDDKDKENRTSTEFNVKANAEAVEKKKEADAEAKKMAEEAADKAKKAEEEAKQKAADEAAKKKTEEETKQKENAINAAFQEIISVGSGFITKIEAADSSKPLAERSYNAYIIEEVRTENEETRHYFIDQLAKSIQSKVYEQTGEYPRLSIFYASSGDYAANSKILDPTIMDYRND